ncbi:ESPR-type extended signal peptide-containing protein, partial [Acinetobacter towneri]
MNKIYRVIWNASLGTWVAVQETAKSKSKQKSVLKTAKKTAFLMHRNFSLSKIVQLLLSTGLVVSSNLVWAASGTNTGSNSGNATSTAISATCSQATTSAQYSISIGCAAGVGYGGKEDVHAIAIGNASTAYAYGVALGTQAIADQSGYTPGKGGVAIGYKAETTPLSTSGIAIGNNATAGSSTLGVNGAIAFGESSNATATNALALGSNTKATKSNSVALGANSTTNTNATIETTATVGKLTYSGFAGKVTDVGMQVSVGSVGAERQIKNVGAGAISATSTDAINGSQLYATNTVLDNVANSTKNILGGNATLNSNGSITMTNIGNTSKNTVHDALLASQEEVAAGTNVSSVTSATGTNGQTIYTVNANGTTASAGSSAVTVTAGTPDANNVTDYAVDLSQTTKDSLVKADTALQSVVTQIDGVDVKTVTKDDNTANFVTGTNIQLEDDGAGGIRVSTADDVTFTNVNTTNLTSTGTTQLGDSFTVNNGGSYYTGPITEGDHIT